jgi:hypothetical protein
MKKQLLKLLVIFFGFTSIYASFPVTENVNSTEISLTSEGPDISKGEKILWFALGLIGSIYGVAASIIYQLITQKKGPIKYALFGFLSLIVLVILLLIAILGDFDNPFIFA